MDLPVAFFAEKHLIVFFWIFKAVNCPLFHLWPDCNESNYHCRLVQKKLRQQGLNLWLIVLRQVCLPLCHHGIFLFCSKFVDEDRHLINLADNDVVVVLKKKRLCNRQRSCQQFLELVSLCFSSLLLALARWLFFFIPLNESPIQRLAFIPWYRPIVAL